MCDNFLYVFMAAPRGCATRRSEALLFEWRWETFAAVLSQQGGEAGGSLIRVVPGRAGAALTKPGRIQYCQMGRVRRAWRKGVREEPVPLRPSTRRPAQTWWIGAGRGASRRIFWRRVLPGVAL